MSGKTEHIPRITNAKIYAYPKKIEKNAHYEVNKSHKLSRAEIQDNSYPCPGLGIAPQVDIADLTKEIESSKKIIEQVLHNVKNIKNKLDSGDHLSRIQKKHK